MAREDHQLKFRVPAGLKAALEESAASNHRSLNAEIIARLEESLIGSGETQRNLEATADLFRMLAKNMRAFRLVMEAERGKPPANPADIPKSSWDEILEIFDTMSDPEPKP
jgi:hypothetical protein